MKKLTLLLALAMLFASCGSDEETPEPTDPNLATVVTLEAVDITSNSATIGVEIPNEGGSVIRGKGIVWSVTSGPTINDQGLYEGIGNQSFEMGMTDLEELTTYYVRGYAENDFGVSYGNEISFSTPEAAVAPPCSPENNYMDYNGYDVNYNTPSTRETGAGWFECDASDGTGNANFTITFDTEPETGEYYTVVGLPDPFTTQCNMSGVFGLGLGSNYGAETGKIVYVENNGNGKFSITFCDVTFSPSSSSAFPFTTDGNLTID